MNQLQGLENSHILVYLEWRTLLSKVYAALKHYRVTQQTYVHHIAHQVLASVRGSDAMRDVFPLIHARCCNGTKLGCKRINVDTEKKIILFLDELYCKKEECAMVYCCDDVSVDDCNESALPRAKSKLKRLQTEVDHFALRLVKNYMRMAIWKEHLDYPLTMLEQFLCCKEGLLALGLGYVPGVWNLYGNLKKLSIYCYKQKACRQCFSTTTKMAPCRSCACVYFCRQGSCASNSRSDPHYGHTEEECALFMAKRNASNQRYSEDQMTPKM